MRWCCAFAYQSGRVQVKLLLSRTKIDENMAQQVQAARHYAFRYRSFHIDKNQPLGHGSYGAVYKAKCDKLPCAAKVLHPTILDPRDPGSDRIMQRFQQECAFLSSIRHPYIVQYLGMTRDPESKLPVLLMELLDSSLTNLLENCKGPLTYHVEVDICHDIALAVSYLHSNDIIHRDLSSNNVLIIAGKRAKVTDFGMSKLAGTTQATMTPLTMCPGTLAYMSPEALSEPPKYTKKLDCFSEGVLMVQICTRLWPDPGPRSQKVPFPSSPTGSIEMPVLETERRKMHIDLINPNHDFLPIIKDSLNYDETKRPSAEELCDRIGNLKEKQNYKQSINTGSGRSQPSEQLQKQLSISKSINEQQKQEIEQQKQEIEKQKEEILGCRQEVAACLQDLQEKNETIALMGNELQRLQEQLEIRDQTIAVMQQADSIHQTRTKHVQFAQSQAEYVSSEPTNVSDGKTSADKDAQPNLANSPPKYATLRWRKENELSRSIDRGSGANVVIDRNKAYFMDKQGNIICYDFETEKWKTLQKGVYWSSGLAVIKGQLSTVGGCDWDPSLLYTVFKRKDFKVTKKLLTLQSHKWVEVYPPLPTERADIAALTIEQYLIVVGGRNKDWRGMNRVDMLNIETLSWSEVKSTPSVSYNPLATVIGNEFYIMDGDFSGLLQNCNLASLVQYHTSLTPIKWHTLESCPVRNSTCTVVNGELIAVGGRLSNSEYTDAVYKYDPATNSWSQIGSMPTARSNCFVTVTPKNELMVVGGLTIIGSRKYACSNKVEIAEFVDNC